MRLMCYDKFDRLRNRRISDENHNASSGMVEVYSARELEWEGNQHFNTDGTCNVKSTILSFKLFILSHYPRAINSCGKRLA